LNKSKIKICGINEIKIIDCCINNGVEYCGLIFYEKSPRFVNLELAVKIINYVNNKKIIYNDTPKTWELYDLKKDPNEINNIYDENLELAKKLKERLLAYLKENNIKTKIS